MVYMPCGGRRKAKAPPPTWFHFQLWPFCLLCCADHQQVHWLGCSVGYGVHLPARVPGVLHSAHYAQPFPEAVALGEEVDGHEEAAWTVGTLW
jgi:hypothetical protein